MVRDVLLVTLSIEVGHFGQAKQGTNEISLLVLLKGLAPL
jgi:hypothetical protein